MLSKIALLKTKVGEKVFVSSGQGQTIVAINTPGSKDVLTEVGEDLIEVTSPDGAKTYYDIPFIAKIHSH